MNATGRRLGDLAALCSGTVLGDAQAEVDRVAAVEDAGDGSLTFAVDERWVERALRTRARAVLAPAGASGMERNGKTLIIVENVRAALATILQSFAAPLPSGEFTHPSAILGDGIKRGASVWIGAGVIVGDRTVIGANCVLLAGSYVGHNVRLGAGTLMHPRSVILDDCVTGDECVLQAGCVIGSDGFGYVRVGAEQIKIPQIGNVVLGDRVEIGACTTIDRAVTGSTIIGARTKIDNQVQVAHNVRIGEDNTICAQTGIAGSTHFGDRVVAAGQSGIVGHIEIGEGSVIAAGAKVISSLPPNSRVSGHYAQPHRDDMKQKVLLRKLPKLFEQVRILTNALEQLRKTQ